MAGEIIAVGLACYDHIVVVPSLERVGEGAHVPTVVAQGGGVAATAAVAARKLGARVQLWARVGDDVHGRMVAEELRRFGVDTSQFVMLENGRTPVSTVLVEQPTGERRFLYFPGQDLDQGWETPEYSRIDRAAAVLVDGRWPSVCLAAMRRARACGVPSIADIGHASGEEAEMLRLADYPVLSELALPELVGRWGLPGPAAAEGAPGISEEGADEFARGLLAGSARAVVVTRGDKGVWLWEPDGEDNIERRELAAFAVDVVDTTGAGDCFHGAFACAIAGGRNAEEATEFASAAGALACASLGGQAGAPTLDGVEALLGGPDRPQWLRADRADA